MAAYETLPASQDCHSLHAYFLAAGDADQPIEYVVEEEKSGRAFSVRRVVARQGARRLFSMLASFHHDEKGYEHQGATAPFLTSVDRLPDEATRLNDARKTWRDEWGQLVSLPAWIGCRWDDPADYQTPSPSPPSNRVWLRLESTAGKKRGVDRAALAYISDFAMLGAALNPHGASWATDEVQRASLDHSIWFHRPFRPTQWLKYSVESPVAFGGRGFMRGVLFDEAGRLVASTTQEALMRPR